MKYLALLSCLATLALANLNTGLMGSWAFDGNGTDGSTNGNNATVTGSGISYVTGHRGQCVKLTGVVNESIDCGNSSTLNAPNGFTCAFWCTIDTTGGFDPGAQYSRVIDKFEAPCIYFAPTLHIYYGDGDVLGDYNPPSDPIDGAWHHWIVMMDTTKKKAYAYQDKVLYDSATITAPLPTSTTHLGIGNRLSDAARFWKGKIDDVQMWSRVLTSAERDTVYAGWTPGSGGGGTTSTSAFMPFFGD
jgi:hypothetical protein